MYKQSEYMLAVLRNVNIANLTYSSPTLIYSTQTHTHTLCLCSMHSRAHLSRQCLFAHARNLVLPCQLLLLVHSCKVSKSPISENPPIPLSITLLSFDNLTLPNYSTEYHWDWAFHYITGLLLGQSYTFLLTSRSWRRPLLLTGH